MACNMSETPIMIAFSKLPDPRRERNRLYTLEDIICTSILATICTCNDYYEISEWTDANLEWLQSIALCLEGAPSHDTYERFFRHLDAKKFQDCFIEWAELLRNKLGKAIAIDGKNSL